MLSIHPVHTFLIQLDHKMFSTRCVLIIVVSVFLSTEVSSQEFNFSSPIHSWIVCDSDSGSVNATSLWSVQGSVRVTPGDATVFGTEVIIQTQRQGLDKQTHHQYCVINLAHCYTFSDITTNTSSGIAPGSKKRNYSINDLGIPFRLFRSRSSSTK